jgi:hypothetical protein
MEACCENLPFPSIGLNMAVDQWACILDWLADLSDYSIHAQSKSSTSSTPLEMNLELK